jgi:DNA-binding SARP family transcriptional activator
MSRPEGLSARPAKLTGGGGFAFEDEVGALLCSALLSAHRIFGDDLGVLDRVTWQVPASSWPLDDVVVTFENESRCSVSIRSFDMLAAGRAEAEFVERAWLSLLGENHFDPARDWLGLVTVPGAEETWRDLHALLSQAAASSAGEMADRMASGSESASRVRLYRSFACPRKLVDSLAISEDVAPAWLLSRLLPLRFDFESRPSSSRTLRTRLAGRSLIDEQAQRGPELVNALLQLVVRRRSRGGSADWPVLQGELGERFAFVARPDAASDVRLLRADTDRRMSGVRSTLGASLELRERSALTAVLESTEANPLVALVGPSGCGKTVLAKQWLSIKADGFWFNASGLSHGLDGLRNQLHLARRPDEVLRLAPWETSVVIDGLDRVHEPEAFAAVRELVKIVASRPDLRLVLTAQDDEWPQLLRQLSTGSDDLAFEVLVTADLDDRDLKELYARVPRLSDFSARNELQDLLRRPKLLDLLVEQLSTGTLKDLSGHDLDEARFAAWFWQHFVEADPSQRIARSATMTRLGEQHADDLRPFTRETEIDAAELASISALVADRLLHREGATVTFGHDLYGDWARYRSLTSHADELAAWLAKRPQCSVWHRALRLRALSRLRTDPTGEEWEAERRELSEAGVAGTSDPYLEAPLFANRPRATLEALWPLLAKDGGALLRRLLDTFLFSATFPDPRAVAAVAGHDERLVDHAAATYRLPRPALWVGLCAPHRPGPRRRRVPRTDRRTPPRRAQRRGRHRTPRPRRRPPGTSPCAVPRRRLAARAAAMNPRRDRKLLVSRIARALPVAIVATTLWILRPGLPQLPDSLTGPTTVDQLEEMLVFLGWLALIVLLALVVIRPMRTTRQHGDVTPVAEPCRGHAAKPRASIGPAGAPVGPAPTLTILAPPDEHQAAHADSPMTGATEPPRQRNALRISLLGSFSIDGVEGGVRGVRSSTEQLLAYLALHPRGTSRDELVEAIWPGEDPRRTRPRLWQSTSEARKLIGDAFISQRGQHSLDRTKITTDADELEALHTAARAAGVPAAERDLLERGLRLLRGEPLVGWDHVWAETDAARLRAMQAELLERLGSSRLTTGDPHGALEAAELALRRDSLNEALWSLAMKAETELGLRESVSRRYERLRTLLDTQLGLHPETATRTLYRDLLGQR